MVTFGKRVVIVIVSLVLSFVLFVMPFFDITVCAAGDSVIPYVFPWIRVIKNNLDYTYCVGQLYLIAAKKIFNVDSTDLPLLRYECYSYWTALCYQGNLSQDKFTEYYQYVLDYGDTVEGSDLYNARMMQQDTVSLGISFDMLCSWIYPLSQWDDVPLVDENEYPVISGGDLKKAFNELDNIYKPRPVLVNSPHGYTSYRWTAENYPKHVWGGKYYNAILHLGSKKLMGAGFEDVYLLPFLQDDDSSVYYGAYQFHLYYSQREDGTHIVLEYDHFHDDNYDRLVFDKPLADYQYLVAEYFNKSMYNCFKSFSFQSYTNFIENNNSVGGKECFLSKDGSFNFVYDSLSANELFQADVLKESATFNPSAGTYDDFGMLFQSTPFEMTYIDPAVVSQIPDSYYITINGDNYYDYSVTNPETGDTTNIYTYIYGEPDNPDNPDTPVNPGGGNVTVGGDVTVKGDIGVNGAIDININVNQGEGDGSSDVVLDDPDLSDVTVMHWYDWMVTAGDNVSTLLSSLFGWLPAEIIPILCITLAGVCVCRFLGR